MINRAKKGINGMDGKESVVVIRNMSPEEKLRELAWQRETMLHDKATALRFARETGYAEGEEKGREEGIAEGIEKGEANIKSKLAKKMREQGYSEEVIQSLMSE